MKTKNNIENLIKKALEESLSKGDSPIVEATLSKAQLDKREDIIKDLKKNKKELVKRYGKDAEAVMYGRATNLAKKAVSEMNKEKLKELVRKSLMNEADIETMADKIGGEDELSLASNLLDDFESKLKSHDWFYMMSDDNRAYTKGSAEESELKKLAKQLANMGYGDDAAEVYDQYNKFDKVSFESYITPPQPFVPMYKRKQMGLDETEFSKEFDNDPALKGGQKKLPDALQKSIIKKEKGVKEVTGPMDTSLNLGDPIDMGKGDPTIQRIGSVVNQMLDAFPALIKQIQVVSPNIFKDKKSLDYANALAKPLKELNILLKDLKQSKIKEDLDLGHEDNEPHMIKAELYRIGKYAMELYQMVDGFEDKGEVDFPAWWQSKITKAQEMMVSAKHYLDFELKEPAIDAMVGVASDEKILDDEAPMMNEDEVTKVDKLAAKIAKALKDPKNKSAEDQNNIKQARKAMNDDKIETAEKIIKPYND